MGLRDEIKQKNYFFFFGSVSVFHFLHCLCKQRKRLLHEKIQDQQWTTSTYSYSTVTATAVVLTAAVGIILLSKSLNHQRKRERERERERGKLHTVYFDARRHTGAVAKD